MKSIDTDSGLLGQIAETTRHAHEQAVAHVEAEIKGVITELLPALS